jgi:hypothetical protein
MNFWEAVEKNGLIRHENWYDGRWIDPKTAEGMMLSWKFLSSKNWDAFIGEQNIKTQETKEETLAALNETPKKKHGKTRA